MYVYGIAAAIVGGMQRAGGTRLQLFLGVVAFGPESGEALSDDTAISGVVRGVNYRTANNDEFKE